MKYKVSEVAQINARNLTKKDQPVVIKYLDTSNLTEGLIKNITILDSRKDKIPSRAKRKVKENDILISTVRPEQKHYGFISKEYEDLIVSTGFAVLTPNTEIVDPYYFYKYLTMDSIIKYLQVIAENSTSAYPSITPNVIGELVIDLPDITIQKRIGRFLRNIDKKIELNYQIITNLEQLAQALFKHWFIDFEFPNENGEPYKSSGGKMVQSELGEIPEGWGIGKFKHIADNFDKRRVPLSKLEREKRQGIYPYYGAASILDYVDDYIFDGIYLLVGEDGSVIDDNGNPILQYVWGKFWVNNHAHVIKGKGNFSTEYIYLLLKNTNVSNILTGAVQPKISQRNLNNIHVIMPKEDILGKFNETIDKIFEFIRVYTDETKKLKKLQGILLPKLLSGKIEIPDESAVTEHDLV